MKKDPANMTAQEHRKKGLRYLEEYDQVMAGFEFCAAIDKGDVSSYSYLGELFYNGGFTSDGDPDINQALETWQKGLEAGDSRSRQLYEEHKAEYIKNLKTLMFENGDTYNGDVDSDDLPHGSGHMEYKLNGYYASYDGMWVHGERSGKGHYHKFSSGGGARHGYDYEGEWLHDKEHGQGVSKNSDETGLHLSTITEVYTGTFKEGRRHGHGVIVRDHYDGNFTNGKDRFEGEFFEGRPKGHGVWQYANGDRFEGEFDGCRQGPGKYTHKNGTAFSGEWKDDRFVEESAKADSSQKYPVLIVTEHHSGFDYNKTGSFRIQVQGKGKALYEDAAVISKDSSFNMSGSGLNILDADEDSVIFEVRGVFMSDGKPVEATIRRGETLSFEDKYRATATIYDDDYHYTVCDSLEVKCL